MIVDPSQLEKQRKLDQLVCQIYQVIESGESIDQQAWIERHPEFRSELESFFSDQKVFADPDSHRVISPTKSDNLSPTQAPAGNDSGGNDSAGPVTAEFIRDYQLLNKLGEGGCGTVYLAVHTKLEKRVALKILNRDRSADKSAIDRFKREIRAVGRLEHQHIVRALDAGEVNGLHYLVMELIEGVDLARLLKHRVCLETADACEVARQAALAIDHAHRHGLIHRDVKPSNLMLTSTGEIKLLDLGLAQMHQPFHTVKDLTVDGQAVGTLRYMAPEQMKDSRSVGQACDVYSLGLTLLELLGGRQLELESEAKREAILRQFKKQRKDIPVDLLDLMRQMTRSNSEERLGDPGEVVRRLSGLDLQGDLPKLFETIRGELVGDERHRSSSPIPPPVVPKSSSSGFRSVSQAWWLAGIFVTVLLLCVGLVASLPSFWSSEAVTDGEVHFKLNGGVSQGVPESIGVLINTTTDESHTVSLGQNLIPEGTYRLILDGLSSDAPSELLVEAGVRESISVRQSDPIDPDFPIQFPKIPQSPGSWTLFNAEVVMGVDPARVKSVYRVELRTLDSQQESDREFQWIKVTVSNAQYNETALLLIDSELYASEQKLVIQRGWLLASVPDHAHALAEVAGEQVVARWSRSEDALDRLAELWGFRWPDNRISSQSVLSIMFDCQHPSVASALGDLRTQLGATAARSVKRIDVQGPKKRISCLEIASNNLNEDSISETETQYHIQRAENSDEVPFSFISVETQTRGLDTRLNIVNYGDAGAVDRLSDEECEAVVSLLADAEIPTSNAFTHAALPKDPGDFSEYSGLIQFGSKLQVPFDVRVARYEQELIDDRPHCWLELSVKTGTSNSDSSFQESVLLLVDEDAYQESRFEVARGWFVCSGEVFDFQNGDDSDARRMLKWLDQDATSSPFTPHQALTLLFGGRFAASGSLSHLRSAISGAVTAASEERDPKPCIIRVRSGESVTGYQWQIETPTLSYSIQRSSRLPFGFGKASMNYNNNSFVLSTEVSQFGTGAKTLLGTPEELQRRASQTRERLDAIGVRHWTFGGLRKQILAKFIRYGEGRVYLESNHSDPDFPLDGIPFGDCSREDHDWVMKTQGRLWTTPQNGNSQIAILDRIHPNREFVDLLWLDDEQDEYVVRSVDRKLLSAEDNQFILQHGSP